MKSLTVYMLIDGNKQLVFKGKPQNTSKHSEVITLQVNSDQYGLIPFEDAEYICEIPGCQEPRANKESQYCRPCQIDMAEMLKESQWDR